MAENLPDTNVGNIKYINKQVAIDALDKEYRYGADINRCGLATALDEIEALPAADVVPVVRCDDCVYYGSRRWCKLHSSVFDDNAFCSYGERKE